MELSRFWVFYYLLPASYNNGCVSLVCVCVCLSIAVSLCYAYVFFFQLLPIPLFRINSNKYLFI